MVNDLKRLGACIACLDAYVCISNSFSSSAHSIRTRYARIWILPDPCKYAFSLPQDSSSSLSI